MEELDSDLTRKHKARKKKKVRHIQHWKKEFTFTFKTFSGINFTLCIIMSTSVGVKTGAPSYKCLDSKIYNLVCKVSV